MYIYGLFEIPCSVCVVRINQYNPSLYVIDTYLAVPIGKYKEVEKTYVSNLNKVLAPWKCHVKEVRGELDRKIFRKKRETSEATR